MRTRAKVAVVLLLAAVAWLPARVGWAKDPATKEEEDKASEAFLGGRYAEARDHYARLRIKNKDEPIYLRNLARCNDKLGDIDEAIVLYNQYLQAANDISPAERGEVEGYIKSLQDRKAEQREKERRERERADREAAQAAQGMQPPAPTPAPAPYPGPSPMASPPPPPTAPPGAGQGMLAPPPPGAPPPAKGDGGAGLRIAGLAAGGLGVVSIALGAYFGAQARDAAHEIEGKAVPGATFNATLKGIDDRGRGDETKEWVFLGAGAGLLVGGGVLYYLGARSAAEADAPPAANPATPAPMGMTLAPAISARLCGATLQGSF